MIGSEVGLPFIILKRSRFLNAVGLSLNSKGLLLNSKGLEFNCYNNPGENINEKET